MTHETFVAQLCCAWATTNKSLVCGPAHAHRCWLIALTNYYVPKTWTCLTRFKKSCKMQHNCSTDCIWKGLWPAVGAVW